MQESNYERINSTRINLGQWIKQQAGWIILIFSSIAFVLKEAFVFQKNDLDVVSLMMSIGLTYFFTFYSAISMYTMGKNEAKQGETFIGALKYLAQAKKDVKDILYLLPKFTQYKNRESLDEAKRQIIERHGLVYKMFKAGYYEKEGVKEFLTKEQVESMAKVNKIRITNLQPNDLLSEHKKTRTYDPLYLGKDERTDSVQKSISLLVNKATFPIITGYFAVTFVFGANLWWGVFQVSIILTMSYLQYEAGKSFIITTLKTRQIKKADLLIEFKNLYDINSPIFKEDIEFMENINQDIKKETV